MGKIKAIIASLLVAFSAVAVYLVAQTPATASQSNDVIYGGTHSVSAANAAVAKYPQLYARYGVTPGLRVELGAAHKNGNITNAAGQIVASDGVSVGRQQLNSASKRFTADGQTWYESANSGPNVFLSHSLPAYIYFKPDGTFAGGIIIDCGNPLGGKNKVTPKNPGIKIEKFVENVKHKTVEVGKAFTYTIRVTNTGNVDLVDVYAWDSAPVGVNFLSASRGKLTGNYWDVTIPKLTAGNVFEYKITAITPEYKEGKMLNKVCVNAKEVMGNPDSCDTVTTDVPKPVIKQVEVCEIATGKIVRVNEGYDTAKYTTDMSKCQPVKVCDTRDNMIKTITRSEYDANKSHYSTNLDDCKPVVVCDTATGKIITVYPREMKDTYTTDQSKCANIEVCVLETQTIQTITKHEYEANKSKYSTNLDDCKQIKVCVIETREIKTIRKSEYDANTMTTDLAKCEVKPETPVTPTPPTPVAPVEMPKTGLSDAIVGTVGLGALVTASYAWIVSRRQLV